MSLLVHRKIAPTLRNGLTRHKLQFGQCVVVVSSWTHGAEYKPEAAVCAPLTRVARII